MMKGRLRVGFVLVMLLLTSVLGLVMNVGLVGAGGAIYIRADGSVVPLTAPIQRDGDVYTFTDNICDSIVSINQKGE